MPATRSKGQVQICENFPKKKKTTRRSKSVKPDQQVENEQIPQISPRKRVASELGPLGHDENQPCSPTKRVKGNYSCIAPNLASPLKSPLKKPHLSSPVRIPLSPRKDVLVNSPIQHVVVRPLHLQSPSRGKQVTPSSIKPASPFRVRALDFDSPVKENTPIVGKDMRKGVSSPQITKARGLNFDEGSCISPRKRLANVKPMSPLHLAKQQGECYQRVKQALHTALPDRLVCREKEMATVNTFLDNHLSHKKPGSLYISGAPGTGKTAVVSMTRQRLQADANCKSVYLNCMSVHNPQAIFNKILFELQGGKETSLTTKLAVQQLEKILTSKGPMVVMILDEIDQLDSKNQEILYTMFEWPTLPKSRLVLIGIANALDLTDRILPRLQARPKCKPELLNFAPYTKDQLIKVLKDRLQSLEIGGESVIEPSAIQFCAMKVAAVAGDMRKALDVCRRAVEAVEIEVRKQQVLSPGCKSPTKRPAIPKKIGVAHILRIVNEVYGNRVTVAQAGAEQTIPLQQKLAMCTLLLILKQGRGKEVTLGKFHEYYSRVCKGQKVAAVDQSEFISMCSHIEARGILSMKKSKDARNAKVTLKLDEKEMEVALRDKTLLSNVLHMGLSAK